MLRIGQQVAQFKGQRATSLANPVHRPAQRGGERGGERRVGPSPALVHQFGDGDAGLAGADAVELEQVRAQVVDRALQVGGGAEACDGEHLQAVEHRRRPHRRVG